MYNPYIRRPTGPPARPLQDPPPGQPPRKKPPETALGGLTSGLSRLFKGSAQGGDWLMVLILFFLYLECGDEDFLIMAAALLLPDLKL